MPRPSPLTAPDRCMFLRASMARCTGLRRTEPCPPTPRAWEWRRESPSIAAENLYVGDRSGTVFKIGKDRQIFVFATIEPSVSAYHLAFGPHGDLFVTGPTTSSFDSVYKIDAHGSVSTFFRGLGRPQGLAFDVEGNLYVAASLSGKRGIVKITPDAKASLEVAGQGLVGLAFAPGRSAVLATTGAVHRLLWDVQGAPLVPDLN